MPIKERDVVLQGRDGGEDTIDLPVTRLANVESGAEVKAEPAQGDYIPIIDSADNEQMKKFPAGWLLEGGLQGPKGDPGEQGLQGEPGPVGADGQSPYEAAVEAGYTGTEAEFYAALVSLQNGPFLPLSGGVMGDNVGIQINSGVLTAPPTVSKLEGLACVKPGTSDDFALMYVGTPDKTSPGSAAASKKYVDDSIAAIPSGGGGGDYLPLAGGDMTGDVDMQNHVITGLPTPVAPSDAVNYQTLIDVFVGKYSVAEVVLSGYDGAGNPASLSTTAVFKKVGNYAADTILTVEDTDIYLTGKINTLIDVKVTLPEKFKWPSTSWSDPFGYSMLSASVDGTGIVLDLVVTTNNIYYHIGRLDFHQQASKVTLRGSVKVGVNA